MSARYFRNPAEFRKWLKANGAGAKELLLGFYKKDSTKRGITYPEALDEALCFGWIDGVRKSVDEDSYTIRFTPRKADSYWSQVNVRHANRLIKEGRMAPSGMAAFERRDRGETQRYSFERAAAEFSPAALKLFNANSTAWKFFQAQPPYYRRVATYWVTSAKREETRARRLQTLIDCCARGERLPALISPKKPLGR
jgi:uncharacterized protein YdeI (YjbR/CyaY-like superfamily)